MVVGGVSPCATTKLSVFVIDDDYGIREYLQDFFHLEGFDVNALGDPTLAIERILGEPFDLIILDLVMPEITGIDLLAQIRAVNDQVPVIIMGSLPSLEAASAAIHHGVSAYLTHPVWPARLREVIGRVLTQGCATQGFAFWDDAVHVEIGRQLRAIRKARHLTLGQVAHRANLSVLPLSRIERGEPGASVASLFAIATALDVRLAELFGGD